MSRRDPLFERIISIDWSGAGAETAGVDLRIVAFERDGGRCHVVSREVGTRLLRSWSRAACRDWLFEQLRGEAPTLVAMDFGFGLPWGADRAVFQVRGWREMIRAVAQRYEQAGTARAMARALEREPRFGGHGPYRFDDSRADFRFYVDHGVAYFRLTDLAAPQAISHWYLGSGGTVGFHTITGMAALHHLLGRREAGEIDFRVWPHEVVEPDGRTHVLAESYPALCSTADDGVARDEHERDALRVLRHLVRALEAGTLRDEFTIRELPFGRVTGGSFDEQVRFEGYILGLR